jgi:hypothetical protein
MFFAPLILKNGFWNTVCLYVWMCSSLVPEWLDEFYLYLVFTCSSIMGRFPVNAHILAPKIGTFHLGSKTQNDDFNENRSINVD